MRSSKWLSITSVLGFLAPAAQGATHPFGWEDLFAVVRLSDPQPSPDGEWILFTRVAYSVEKNRGNLDLAMVSADGRDLRPLTSNPAVDNNGRWQPDGKAVLFLSNRSGSAQVWRLPIAGGEAAQVTDLPVSLDGFEISPDGTRLLLLTGVFVDCKDLACTAKRLKEQAENPVQARIFERLFIRHWDIWNDGRRNHLFVMNLSDQRPIDLTAGMDQDSPPKPFGGSDEVAWSPDGKSLAFTSKPAAGEAWTTNVEIMLVGVDGKQKPRYLTSDNPATDTAPVFSPDGTTLAYLAMDRPGFEADRLQIVLLNLKTGEKKRLTSGWDRSVRSVAFSADGATLYVTAEETARVKLFAIDTQSGTVRPLLEQGTITPPRLTRKGTLVFVRHGLAQPPEIYAYNPATTSVTQLTRFNEELLRSVRVSQPEEFWFDNDGFKVHGWLFKPVDFVKGKKYPLAMMIHGGPQGSWADEFHFRWNPQFYAGAGYVTIGIDFRGSTGYGQAFSDANRGNWGPGPFSDLMVGLAQVLKDNPYIDKDRMCALGASYGGYMANYIAGQEHPFKCLVSHDGDFDTISSYFNTEELWFPEWEMKGPPWQTREIYERNSPATNVHRWKTPMLVIHGALDFRVVETEGFSTFSALQRLGVPSKFLYFPDENHWVLKPQNSRLWHKTVLEWIDQWTKTPRKKTVPARNP